MNRPDKIVNSLTKKAIPKMKEMSKFLDGLQVVKPLPDMGKMFKNAKYRKIYYEFFKLNLTNWKFMVIIHKMVMEIRNMFPKLKKTKLEIQFEQLYKLINKKVKRFGHVNDLAKWIAFNQTVTTSVSIKSAKRIIRETTAKRAQMAKSLLDLKSKLKQIVKSKEMKSVEESVEQWYLENAFRPLTEGKIKEGLKKAFKFVFKAIFKCVYQLAVGWVTLLSILSKVVRPIKRYWDRVSRIADRVSGKIAMKIVKKFIPNIESIIEQVSQFFNKDSMIEVMKQMGNVKQAEKVKELEHELKYGVQTFIENKISEYVGWVIRKSVTYVSMFLGFNISGLVALSGIDFLYKVISWIDEKSEYVEYAETGLAMVDAVKSMAKTIDDIVDSLDLADIE